MQSAPEEKPHWVDSNRFNLCMGVVISLNAVLIGIEVDQSYANPESKTTFSIINDLFLLIYVTELTIRFGVHGKLFMRDSFNAFDCFLVLSALLERFVLSGSQFRAFSLLRFMRLARLLRLVRLFRFFRELLLVVAGVLVSLRTTAWVGVLLFCVCWTCSLFARPSLGESDEWLFTSRLSENFPFEHFANHEYFGTVGGATMTLLQVTTRSQWSSNIVRPIMERQGIYLVFFVAFLLAVSYGLLNIVVGCIVADSVTASVQQDYLEQELLATKRKILIQELARVFEAADSDGNGELDEAELAALCEIPEVAHVLAKLQLPAADAGELLKALDVDGDGTVDREEFMYGMAKMRGKVTSQADEANQLMVRLQGLSKLIDSLNMRCNHLQDLVDDAQRMLTTAMTMIRRKLTIQHVDPLLGLMHMRKQVIAETRAKRRELKEAAEEAARLRAVAWRSAQAHKDAQDAEDRAKALKGVGGVAKLSKDAKTFVASVRANFGVRLSDKGGTVSKKNRAKYKFKFEQEDRGLPDEPPPQAHSQPAPAWHPPVEPNIAKMQAAMRKQSVYATKIVPIRKESEEYDPFSEENLRKSMQKKRPMPAG